ncbi:hypothetical protein LMG24238_07373 [Paraburkholderia sediminicola]|uniref:Uncharacterized protein n=1 Tax=Paraburkholderia sediminicola TaxID=458836 RepID=A0A6J5CW04_9BURK|nr:hypothetical protein LMG24238_07373 [Paraburkholderia sediminicola]
MGFIAMHTQSHEHDDCFGFREGARYISQLYEPHQSEIDATPTQFCIMHATQRWIRIRRSYTGYVCLMSVVRLWYSFA